MRTINEQLKDIITGSKTPMDIITEGVNDYAVSNYTPQTFEEGDALRALRAIYTSPPDQWILLDEEFSFEDGRDDDDQ